MARRKLGLRKLGLTSRLPTPAISLVIPLTLTLAFPLTSWLAIPVPSDVYRTRLSFLLIPMRVEGNRFPFIQSFEAVLIDTAEVDEDILRAITGRDKTEALLTEELDCAGQTHLDNDMLEERREPIILKIYPEYFFSLFDLNDVSLCLI